MKKTIFTLALATTLTVGTIFTGCDSFSEANSEANVEEAKVDVNEAKQVANTENQQTVNAEEWNTFKTQTDEKIKNNEIRIAEIREKMKTSGKTMDAIYAKKIDALEQKNKDMQTRINTFDMKQSSWDSFKREFNHDMDELGQAFKDLGTDNKK